MDLIASHGRLWWRLNIRGHVTAAYTPSSTKNSHREQLHQNHTTIQLSPCPRQQHFLQPSVSSVLPCCCHACSARCADGSSKHGRRGPASWSDNSTKHWFWHLSQLCCHGSKHWRLGWCKQLCQQRQFQTSTC